MAERVMVVFGTPLALVLARRRFRGQVLVETMVDLPIVLPPSVAEVDAFLADRSEEAYEKALEILSTLEVHTVRDIRNQAELEDCVTAPCSVCGACDYDVVKNRVYEAKD